MQGSPGGAGAGMTAKGTRTGAAVLVLQQRPQTLPGGGWMAGACAETCSLLTPAPAPAGSARLRASLGL